MAFNPFPSAWLPASTNDATYVKLAYTDFPEITQAEATQASGDIRKVYYGLCEGMFNSFNDTAVADRPTRMQMTKSVFLDTATGLATYQYVMTFNNLIVSADVAPE